MPSSLARFAESGYGHVEIMDLVEGPTSLLAVGTEGGNTCGDPATYDALWSSSDGVVWRPVRLPKTWASSIVPVVDGGSTGYIAGAMDSDRIDRLWISHDGRAWRAVRMPTSTQGRVEVEDAASFAGGYVLVGAFLDPGGCGGPTLVHPSVWWSPNGKWWARIPLGAARKGADLRITVTRLSDREVVATVGDGARAQRWVSANGRHWTRIAAHSVLDWCLVSDGSRPLCVDTFRRGLPYIATVGTDLSLRPFGQTGSGPMASDGWDPTYQIALGPTGVLAVGNGA